MDETLQGGRFSKPVRRGDTVQRRRGTANAHALLQHLERAGFELAPRFLRADAETETLSYLPGEAGYPPLTADLRSDEALVNVAQAIRRLHDATAGFEPVDPEAWNDLEVAAPVRIDCIGHHDLAPWNLVFDGPQVVGIIDWDTIRPSNRVWDLAYATHQFVPFHPPGLARAVRLADRTRPGPPPTPVLRLLRSGGGTVRGGRSRRHPAAVARREHRAAGAGRQPRVRRTPRRGSRRWLPRGGLLHSGEPPAASCYSAGAGASARLTELMQ